jgi:putative DNA primase/helicase
MWMLLHPLTDIHEEQDIWEGFEEQHPFILGALLYAVSAALRHWDTAKLSAKPRMADFARWIAAAEAGGALPWGGWGIRHGIPEVLG